jgi:hypothetical protein
MLRVGERFNLSSNYMARVCIELRVPRPPRGYWAQLEVGKAPAKPTLPAARPGDITEWSPGGFLGSSERAAQRQARAAGTENAEIALAAPAPRGRSRSERQAEKPHPLLIGIKPLFEKARKSENGILRPLKRLMADIVVSKDQVDRAIEVADSIFQGLTARGHRVAIAPLGAQMRRADVDVRESPRKDHFQHRGWSPDRCTVVYISEVPIGLTLFEMTETTEMQYVGTSTYVPVSTLSQVQLRRYENSHYWRSKQELPSGRLCLQAYCPSWYVGWVKQWAESKPQTLFKMFDDIVAELELRGPQLAAQVKSAVAEAEQERLRWEEEDRRRREAAERERQEKRRQEARSDLLGAISAWDEARRIAAFFGEAEQAAEVLGKDARQMALERIAIARQLIGEPEPLNQLLRWKAPHERG